MSPDGNLPDPPTGPHDPPDPADHWDEPWAYVWSLDAHEEEEPR